MKRAADGLVIGMAMAARKRPGRLAALLLAAAMGGGGLLAAGGPALAQLASAAGHSRHAVAATSTSQAVPAFSSNTARPAADGLASVSCPSATFCIAVGESAANEPTPAPKALAERWDGHRWVVLHSVSGGELRGVSCLSTRFCLAVGGTQAEQWNGRSWQVRKGLTGGMAAVACTSVKFCMAVGSDGEGQANTAAVWNGLRWRSVPVPDSGCLPYCGLSGVACRSASACVAVGSGYSDDDQGDSATGEAWNGSKWRDIGTVSKDIIPQMRGVSCTSTTSCVAVGDYQSEVGPCGTCAMAGSWNGQSWQDISPASVQGALNGVSCTSQGHCIAVGDTLSLQLNGTTWQPLAIAEPGDAGTFLSQVSCWSPSGCMAVGRYNRTDGAQLTLSERWNGTSWQVRRTPSPADLSEGLSSVSCPPSAPCLAVGAYVSSSDQQRALAEQRTARGWRVLPAPSPGAAVNVLAGVSCPAKGRCVAVGYYGTSAGPQPLAEQWDGTSWHQLTVPGSGSLDAVACTAPDSCQAVGSARSGPLGPALPVALSWNGSTWQNEPTPGLGTRVHGNLAGVSCVRAGDCVAVGFASNDPRNTPRPLAEMWNGSAWRLLPAPPPGSLGELSSVSCPASTFCVAVGSYLHAPSLIALAAPAAPLAVRWNGTSWAKLATPVPAHHVNGHLGGVWCVRRTRCSAAGRSTASAGHVAALAEAWTGGSRWTLQSIPSPDQYYNELFGISCTKAASCTAVGLTGVQLTFASELTARGWHTVPTVNP